MATLCFATMCRDESKCILDTLESVYKYIDYWIVCDTGSTDNTCELVKNFFDEKNIPGELYVDEWVDFAYNKNIMFEKVYNKSDYVLHFDSDDWLMGNFKVPEVNAGDIFHYKCKRGSFKFNVSILYNNRLKWKLYGVRHTIIKCIDKQNIKYVDNSHEDVWLDAEDRGHRSTDPEKYNKDGKALEKQFWDTLIEDPDGLNTRSVFYTAQSYCDYGDTEKALRWYFLYLNLKNTWIEEEYETYLRIGKIYMSKNNEKRARHFIDKSISIFPDRAEGYLYFGRYCNQKQKFDLSKEYLSKGIDCKKNHEKYKLFIHDLCYGAYCLDEYAVALYWLGDYRKSKQIIESIINLPEMENNRERLQANIQFCNNKLT